MLALEAHPDVVNAGKALCEAFGRVAGAAVVVDEARMLELLGTDPPPAEFDRAPARLLDWCESQEADGRSLIFAGQDLDGPWTRWCMRQTDKIVLVARADADVDLEALDRRFAGRTLAGQPVQPKDVDEQKGC